MDDKNDSIIEIRYLGTGMFEAGLLYDSNALYEKEIIIIRDLENIQKVTNNINNRDKYQPIIQYINKPLRDVTFNYKE